MAERERPGTGEGQTYTRWFTDYPSTHERAGETVEVTPVSAKWEKENLCGICPYRQAVQAENDRLRDGVRQALALVAEAYSDDEHDDSPGNMAFAVLRACLASPGRGE